MEKLIPIKWYEWLYSISSHWIVYSHNYKRLGITNKLSPWNNWKWYLFIFLYLNKKRNRVYIHRVVASHFKENPLLLPEVNHIDWDKSNNNDWNVEWCSVSDNKKHNFRVLWYKTSFQTKHPDKWKFWYDNIKSKEVHMYSNDGTYIKSFWSKWLALRSINRVSMHMWISKNWLPRLCWWFIFSLIKYESWHPI